MQWNYVLNNEEGKKWNENTIEKKEWSAHARKTIYYGEQLTTYILLS